MTQPKTSDVRVQAIILAGGKGTRMNSPIPKVLHPVAGSPMVRRVVDALKPVIRGTSAGLPGEIRVVVGHGEALVRKVVEPVGVTCFVQKLQLGTADAVKSAQIDDLEGIVLIVNGDHPLIQTAMIAQLLKKFRAQDLDLAVASAVVKNPGDFGRIVRRDGKLVAIVEAREAGRETLAIREINSGMYLVKAEVLKKILPQISNSNSKGEYYLTDLVSLSQTAGYRVDAIPSSRWVAFGVNSQVELALANQVVFRRNVRRQMDKGAVFLDPKSVYLEDDVNIRAGSVIYPGCYLRGLTSIGSYCVLEPNVYMSNAAIKDGVQIKAGSYIENATIGPRAHVGPYARIRPETVIGEDAHIGNFVELKKTNFGARSKAGHLTYLGDAVIGEDTNIGCGTITCNYAADRKKYQTNVGNNVFVGSDSQFVAPVTIGDGAVIASGSTITADVPARALAIARSRQVVKEDWKARPPKPKDKSEREVGPDSEAGE